MEKVVYIHYGSKAFDSANGFPIHNRKDWNKPQGGLWASRETASFGWKDWCEQEHFRECDPLNSFRFMQLSHVKQKFRRFSKIHHEKLTTSLNFFEKGEYVWKSKS